MNVACCKDPTWSHDCLECQQRVAPRHPVQISTALGRLHHLSSFRADSSLRRMQAHATVIVRKSKTSITGPRLVLHVSDCLASIKDDFKATLAAELTPHMQEGLGAKPAWKGVLLVEGA